MQVRVNVAMGAQYRPGNSVVPAGGAGKHGPRDEGREVRLPLQGGLPPVDGLVGAVVEIACDESGFSGSNLLDPATPVITHASVDLKVDEAHALIATLPTGLSELKSGQVLRSPRADETVELLLTTLTGRAHVHLVDKEFFLVTRVVDLFLADASYAAGTRLSQEQRPVALALYRAGRLADPDWGLFLTAFTDVVRTKRRQRPDDGLIERFFQARDGLARRGLDARAQAVLAGLDPLRVRDVVSRLTQDDRSIPPPLEPMLPALAETVLFWSGGQRQVLVVHDEQSALTPDRLRRLQVMLADGGPAADSPFAGLVTVDSRDDPRVQVADVVAGLARRSAENGYGGLLQPFLSPTSLHDPGADDASR
jgi:hypothetical protein